MSFRFLVDVAGTVSQPGAAIIIGETEASTSSGFSDIDGVTAGAAEVALVDGGGVVVFIGCVRLTAHNSVIRLFTVFLS